MAGEGKGNTSLVKKQEGGTANADDSKVSLYTCVLDFQGGTYLSQVKATDPVDAKRRWAMQAQRSEVKELEELRKQSFVEEVEDEHIVPVTDITNTWCFSIYPCNHGGFVHVIRTAQKEGE